MGNNIPVQGKCAGQGEKWENLMREREIEILAEPHNHDIKFEKNAKIYGKYTRHGKVATRDGNMT